VNQSGNIDILFEICCENEDQAQQIMQWRNDPTTLQHFYHHEPKVWETFWVEYCDEYLTGGPRPVFALQNGERVAFLRFNTAAHPAGSAVDISINVAPDARGRGVGARVLLAVRDHLIKQGVVAIIAEVRQANTASLKAFRKAGYESQGLADITVPDTGESVTVHRFVQFLGDQ